MEMNSGKENNGWTLNPSKSFPGKFYYFNVNTGESVWTTDPEKNISKDPNTHKTPDRKYYPREPSTPPPDFPSAMSVPHTTNQTSFQTQRVMSNNIIRYQLPTFGKAAFPNYMPNIELYAPNIIWVPISLPTPYVTKIDDRQCLTTSTQTESIEQVHAGTSTKRQSERFNVNINKSPSNRQVQKKYETSTPLKCLNDASTQSSFDLFKGSNESSIPISNFKRVRTKSETDKDTNEFQRTYRSNSAESILLQCKEMNSKIMNEPFKRNHTVISKSNKAVGDLESISSISIDRIVSQDYQKEPYQIEQENECTNIDDGTKEKDVLKLDDNDLRLLLLAKKRKSVDLGAVLANTSKKIKTYKEDNAEQCKNQKRVSFNLQPEDSEADDAADEVVHTNEEVEELDLPKDLCYVMVDADTLVDEYQLVEEFVLADGTRRLLLPRCLVAAIETMGMGLCRYRRRVVDARQSARRLAQTHSYIVMMPNVDISGITLEISDVLKYCLKINRLGYFVVFLTNSAKLLTDAKLLKITHLNTKQINLKQIKPPEITFELKKVQGNVNNDCSDDMSNKNASPSSDYTSYFPSNRVANPEAVVDKEYENSENANDKMIQKVDANTSPIGSNEFVEFSDKNKTNHNNYNNVTTHEKEGSNLGKDMQNLFLNEPATKEAESTLAKANKEKEKTNFVFQKPIAIDIKKKYGSRRFDVKSDLMEETIRSRLDEWICTLSQIVEDACTQVLMRFTRNSDNTIRPWVLYDVVDNVKKLYECHTKVRSIADKFTTMLIEQCSQIGYLKTTMTPKAFMELFECAYLLIQALQDIQPHFDELWEAEVQLENLLKEIENPTHIILPVATPVSSSDIVIESRKRNFVRHRSEILEYVKEHFGSWTNDDPPQEEEENNLEQNEDDSYGDFKIVRTFGRNINRLNIDGKSLTVTNPTETVEKDIAGNTKEDNVTSTNNLLEDLNLSNSETWVDENSNNKLINDELESTKQINMDQNMATPLQDTQVNTHLKEPETKISKEIEIIDLDALDYSEIKDSDSDKTKTPPPMSKNNSDMSMTDAVSFVYEIRNVKSKVVKVTNDSFTNRSFVQESNIVNNAHESNVKADVLSDSVDIISVKDDSVGDSGIENDSVHAHSLARVFLIELTHAFKIIHTFINNCVEDFRSDGVREEQKLRIHAKANYLFFTLADIIAELKKIIQRESNDCTAVQPILLRAGTQAAEDKRISRYKQVVIKCMEQAITLENGLKLILSMTGDDCDGSISTYTLNSNIRNSNIYDDNTVPIKYLLQKK